MSSQGDLLEPKLASELSVKLIGLGGVGGIVARYLAIFLAAQRASSRLVLIDGASRTEAITVDQAHQELADLDKGSPWLSFGGIGATGRWAAGAAAGAVAAAGALDGFPNCPIGP